MQIKLLLIGALATCATTVSLAQQSDISYTYLGASYDTLDIDGRDFDGFSLEGSAEIHESLFIHGSYSSWESDESYSLLFVNVNGKLEATELNLGVGFHTPIAPTTDFVGTFTYSDHELKSDFGNADGNGYILNAGLRSMPMDNVEFDAFIYYEDFEDDNEIGFSFSGRFYPTPQFSVGLGYDTSDDVDIISLEARLNIDLPR